MLLSVAVVSTDASERYGKQLLSHLGSKVQTEPLPDRPAASGRLLFAYGVGTVLPMPGELILRATAANQESLARVQDVLQRHLEKFGARRELAVTWGPVENTPDTDDAAGAAVAAGSDTPESTENSTAPDDLEQAPARTD